MSVAGIVLWGWATLVASENTPPAIDVRSWDKLIEASRDFWNVPGVAVAVVRGDTVLYLKGHGVRSIESRQPVTPDTVFPLASCSKAFSSTLLAMLADENKIRWDDPVRRYLPYFRLQDPHADALVTLRDLMCHRTGLGSHDLLWYRADWGNDEMIRRAGRLTPSYPFRSGFAYQSVMVTAAGLAMARAVRRPWHELVQERIFDPLNMRTAGVRSVAALRGEHALGHRLQADGSAKVVPWYRIDEPNPAGSIHASIRDLVPWLQLHANGGRVGERRLVSAEKLAETHQGHVVLPLDAAHRALHPHTVQLCYALGWVTQDYRGRRLVSHAGIIDGFRAHLAILPDQKIGVAVLANAHATRMNLALSNTLIDQLLGVPAEDWNTRYRAWLEAESRQKQTELQRQERQRRADRKPTLDLQSYAGDYTHPAYGTASILWDGQGLVWAWGRFRLALSHWDFDRFRFQDEWIGDHLLEFRLGAGPQVEAFDLFDVRFTRQAQSPKQP